jgi:hypothetical protein
VIALPTAVAISSFVTIEHALACGAGSPDVVAALVVSTALDDSFLLHATQAIRAAAIMMRFILAEDIPAKGECSTDDVISFSQR